MKRKSLLFLLLLALVLPWAANAQETLTVYENGTATNNYVPMYGGYFDDYTKSEFVIPAEKLEDMVGGTITAMKFYIQSVSTYGSGWDNTHQVVFLKEVESTTLSAYSGTDGATIVFDGMFTVPTSTDTEFEITFTENTYVYEGGNLLVGIYNTDDGQYRTVTWYGETVNGASGGSSNGTSLDNITFSQRNFIPKTTFTYTAGEAPCCPKPKNLTCTGYTANTATFTWTNGGDETQWQLEYGTASDFSGASTATINQSDLVNGAYTLTGLTAEQTYYARIKAYCPSCTPNYSDPSNTCEFKPSVVQTVTIGSGTGTHGYLPTQPNYDFSYTQQIYTAAEIGQAGTIKNVSFKGNKAGTRTLVVYMANTTKEIFSSITDYIAISEATQVFSGSVTFTANEWKTIELTGDGFDYDGTNLAIIVDDNSDNWTMGTTSWLSFTTTGNQGLYFYQDNTNIDPSNPSASYKGVLTSKNQIQLSIIPSATPKPRNLVVSDITTESATVTWTAPADNVTGYQYQYKYATTPTWPDTWNSLAANVTHKDLVALAANTLYDFRVRANYAEGDSDPAEIQFTTEATCMPVTNITASDITSTSATMAWDDPNGATSWQYICVAHGDTPDWTSDLVITSFTHANVPANILSGTGQQPQPNTEYDFYVRANCGDGDYSEAAMLTFRTECGIITIDASHSWEEGFEDYNVGTNEYSGVAVTDIQCWARVQVNSSTNSPFVYRNYSSAASTGLASLEMKTSNNIPVMVALPEFSESIENLNVAFNYNCTNANTTYTAELGYITDVTDASTFTKLFDIPTPVSRSGHSEYSQDLYENAAAANAPAGSRLAILISNTVYSPVPSWNFDDFVVSYVPPCRKPSGLAFVEGYPTAHEVSFTWEAEEGEMFEYAMLHGTITDFTEVNWGQAEETNTATWNNLFANYDYTLALRKVCGVDNYSPVVSISFRTPQEPVSVPFEDDFEDGQNWVFVNGDLTNAWAYGEATSNGGTHALYISNDGGTNNAYSTGSAAMVYATKLFTFEDGVYKFSYDWKANGESTWDYLRVALVPASVTLTAGTSAPSVPSGNFYDNLPEGWIALDGGGKLNLVTDWQSFASDEIEIAAGTYMMVFAWKDDTNGGTNPPAAIDNVSITIVTCITPTGLAYSNVKSNKVDLTWTSDADAWQICINDDEENLVDVAASDVTIEEGVVAYTLTGLTEETAYTVKVRANCGSDDGVSAWTEALSFTTIAPCSVEDVTISNISHYAADVTWTGESAEGYMVKYRTAATASASPLFSEDFEDETSFANWTFTSMNTANASGTNGAGRLEAAAHNGSYGFRFSSYSSADDYNQYLVSPELTVTGVLKFFYKKTSDNNTETLQVGYSTTTNDYATAFTWIDLTLTQSWQESADITLPDGVKYIAFHYYGDYAFYVYVDDITISEPVPAGEWQTIPAASEAISANLSGLTPGTMYDLQVVPNCDETLASETQQFSTVPENVKWFITEGNWGTAANWEPTGVPTIEQDVTLMANTTIESGCVAEANIISTNTHTLTIEDGGQLKHNNSSYFTATVKKNVTGYGADNYNTNNGYVLIGLPCSISLADDNSDGVNLRTGTYDLYTWNGTADLEWLNHGSSDNDGIPLALSRFHGFLYANQEGAELIFTGDIYGSSNNYLNNITYTAPSEGTSFSDWNLIGNPFVCDAYLYGISSTGLESTLSYYKMNDAGNGFEAVAGGTVIAPMQGIFCQAPSGSYSSTVYFTRTAPVAQSEGKLNMNLRSDNKQLDNAILVFGGEQQMGKMTFRANSSKIYMPVDGKDYAIATAESNMGEMPVSFKAEHNGTYTLSFNAEEVSFAYLHLIDNLTGVETDLLSTPSYSFEASTTDYASRFRLVFATGNNGSDDNFAFFSNGSFVINNDGEATLQVVDVMGRIVMSETVNGCANVNVNAAPGVYMLRLINGDNVKVQKVVVR